MLSVCLCNVLSNPICEHLGWWFSVAGAPETGTWYRTSVLPAGLGMIGVPGAPPPLPIGPYEYTQSARSNCLAFLMWNKFVCRENTYCVSSWRRGWVWNLQWETKTKSVCTNCLYNSLLWMFTGWGFGLGSSALTELAFGGFIQDLPPPGVLHT